MRGNHEEGITNHFNPEGVSTKSQRITTVVQSVKDGVDLQVCSAQ